MNLPQKDSFSTPIIIIFLVVDYFSNRINITLLASV